MIDFNTLQKLPKNVGYLGTFIVAKGFKKLPKVQKSPDLVTLIPSNFACYQEQYADTYMHCSYYGVLRVPYMMKALLMANERRGQR